MTANDERELAIPLPDGFDVYEFMGRHRPPYPSGHMQRDIAHASVDDAWETDRITTTERDQMHASIAAAYPDTPSTTALAHVLDWGEYWVDSEVAAGAVRRMCERWAWLLGSWSPPLDDHPA